MRSLADCDIDPQDKRYTTVHSRYQLSCESEGFLTSCTSKADAIRTAARLANKRGEMIEVFDVMARRGGAQLWEVHPGIADDAGTPIVLPPAKRREQ